MKVTEKACANCNEYGSYYRAGCFGFWEEREGVCNLNGGTVGYNHSCNLFVRATRKRELSVQLLDEAVCNVQFILNYFKNDK